MGTYVYAVRRKNISVTLSDGTTVRAWLAKYLYKPSYSREYYNRRYRAVMAHIENAFVKAGDRIDYVVWVHEKVGDGDRVYAWDGRYTFHDGDGSGILKQKMLGFLKRAGRKWIVVPEDPCAVADPVSSQIEVKI